MLQLTWHPFDVEDVYSVPPALVNGGGVAMHGPLPHLFEGSLESPYIQHRDDGHEDLVP